MRMSCFVSLEEKWFLNQFFHRNCAIQKVKSISTTVFRLLSSALTIVATGASGSSFTDDQHESSILLLKIKEILPLY